MQGGEQRRGWSRRASTSLRQGQAEKHWLKLPWGITRRVKGEGGLGVDPHSLGADLWSPESVREFLVTLGARIGPRLVLTERISSARAHCNAFTFGIRAGWGGGVGPRPRAQGR